MMDGVDIWLVPIDAIDHWTVAGILSEDERRKAASFKVPELGRRYGAAHGALRLILAGYLAGDPATLAFAANPWGKPHLTEQGLQFNLSHSGPWALVAVCGEAVGIDVEIMAGTPPLEVAPLVLSPLEQDLLHAAPAARQAALFYGIWTRKEALAKAIGLGLSLDLAAITVCGGDGSFLETVAADGTVWRVSAVREIPSSAGAMVTAGTGPVRIRRFDLPQGLPIPMTP